MDANRVLKFQHSTKSRNFQSKIIAQTRAMLPGKICGMLPSLVDDKVNSQLAGLPQAIPIMKMVSYVSVLTAKPRRLPQHVSPMKLSIFLQIYIGISGLSPSSILSGFHLILISFLKISSIKFFTISNDSVRLALQIIHKLLTRCLQFQCGSFHNS